MRYPEIARRFKIAMDRKNIKARELAKKADVNESMISHYVNGRYAPSNISAAKIADILGVSPVWLMGFDVSMTDTAQASPKSTDDHYYIDEKARELAQFLYRNPQYNILFDATRNVKPEDIGIVKALLDKFKG